MLNQWQDVLLIRKQKPAWMVNKLNGIGGHVEEGETPLQAMVREFREETGCSTKEGDWTEIIIATGKGYRLHIFRTFCENFPLISSYQEKGSKEQLEIRSLVSTLAPIQPAEVVDGLLWMLPLCADKGIEAPVIQINYHLKGDG